jgi:hypothetical protein
MPHSTKLLVLITNTYEHKHALCITIICGRITAAVDKSAVRAEPQYLFCSCRNYVLYLHMLFVCVCVEQIKHFIIIVMLLLYKF